LGTGPFGWAQPLTLVLFIGPILFGLLGALLPAFGIQPALGLTEVSLDPWRALFLDPGFRTSLGITFIGGFGATLLAVLIGFSAIALLYGTRVYEWLKGLLAPALAFPHASFAIGLAFLIAPSGWLARLFSPWATGWTQPPDILIVGDPAGLSLALALGLKEALFLMLVIVGAVEQINCDRLLRSARTMGYGRVRAWLLVVAPQVYVYVRLPIYAMLASALTIVDMAIVLGPTAPPTLALLTLDWYGQLEVGRQSMASASAIFQLGLVVFSIGVWRIGEWILSRAGKPWLSAGTRDGLAEHVAGTIGGLGIILTGLLSLGAVIVLCLWSFAGTWSWPDAFPLNWSIMTWERTSKSLVDLAATSILIALSSTLMATFLAIMCLEASLDRSKPTWLSLLYVPLLVPQISFLFGLQILWNWLWLDTSILAVVFTHLLFVLPYVILMLADPYRKFDPQIARAAQSLGASRWRTLITVKLPILAGPIAAAMAIGFAVSVAQYLPTVYVGAGQVETLTTEAVALASGADRRLAGVTAFALMALPFIALVLANAVPKWLRLITMGRRI
jgi:putative thiamine transport system permease protein